MGVMRSFMLIRGGYAIKGGSIREYVPIPRRRGNIPKGEFEMSTVGGLRMVRPTLRDEYGLVN